MSEILKTIFDGIMEGKAGLVKSEVQRALDEGLNPGVILQEGMIAAMAEVGRLFEEGEYFVPEMLIAARAMKQGLEVLQPHLQAADIQPIGKVAIGTVKGDLHDIGKNLVGMMLEGNGFDIIDLGVDVTPEMFVNAVVDKGAKLVGLSSLLTTTMPGMAAVIDAFEDAGVRDQVKIMIGGAPVTQEYADKIGADGYATDASSAVTLAKSLLN